MLSNQRFVLTGCASGIGRRLTGELLARGHRVLATDVDPDALARAAAGWLAEEPGGELVTHTLDVRDPDAWDEVLDRAEEAWDGFDVLLNIAGVIRPSEIHRSTVADVHLHFDVNVKGVAFGTRAAGRRLVARGGGHIVNIASLASLAPIPGIGLYSASKYAVRALSLAAAEELRPHGVAVTTLCPDAVDTPMLDLQLDYEQAALTFTAPRILTPGDVVRVVLRALDRRPLMVAFPRHRAWLARFADLFPGLQRRIAGLLHRRGLTRQAELRRERRGS